MMTPLTARQLRRRLKTGAALDKDALIKSRRRRLPDNPHRNRDRRIERAMLQALIGPGASAPERQQALDQANCTLETPCRHLTCWLCKHRAWLRLRSKLGDMLVDEVPDEAISWVTIVIAVCKPTPKALRQWTRRFRYWAQLAAQGWGLAWFGRFEADLLLDPAHNTGTFKRKTLHELGLDHDDPRPVVVLHVHLITYHSNLKRALLAYHLKCCIPGTRRTQAKALSRDQAQTEALDNLTRYMVKSLPPEDALFGAGSTLCRPADPEALRLYNKLLLALTGKKGECVIR
jgi:hypothetical protein